MDRFEYTKKRIIEGASIRQIGRELNVDHSTISYWIKNDFTSRTGSTRLSINEIHSNCYNKSAQYSYILGCYLGDGHISQLARTQRLRIFSGTAHPSIIKDQVNALNVLFDNVVNNKKSNTSNMEVIRVHNTQLDIYFPQHGLGKKHDRDVSLKQWQQDLIDKELECFVKGLIDTDGCLYDNGRYVKHNGEKTYLPSYQFTNKSKDVLKMYTDTLDKLGIHYTYVPKKCGSVNVFTRNRVDVQKLFDVFEIAERKISC